MAFLSGLFRPIPSGDFGELAAEIVRRFSTPDVLAPWPDLAGFRSALEAAHARPVQGAELRQIGERLEAKQYALTIVEARELMSRDRSMLASCLQLIGAAYFRLHFYREAIRHYAAAARFEGSFEPMVKNLQEAQAALHATPPCRLSRLVLAVVATDAFDEVINDSTAPKEAIGALLARGEVARRLGAPHLAMQDFSRAENLGEYTATKTMIVLAAADLGDQAATDLAPRAKESPAFRELDSRLEPVLSHWEAAAREEWKNLLPRLEALEKPQ